MNAHILETDAGNHRTKPQLQFQVQLAKTELVAVHLEFKKDA